MNFFSFSALRVPSKHVLAFTAQTKLQEYFMLHNFFIQGPPEAVEMDLSQEGPDQTFDPLHEIN